MVELRASTTNQTETPMTETTMPLIELLQNHDDGDFLRAVTEGALQMLKEHDVEGLIGGGRYERGEGRQTWRNGYRDREFRTRLGALNPAGCRSCGRAPVSRAFSSRAGQRWPGKSEQPG